MRRDADVIRAEVRREGVLGRHEHERALAQTLYPEQVLRECLLLRDRAAACQEILADGLALGDDALHQRHDALLQRTEERVELDVVVTLLVIVEQRVVICGLLLVAQVYAAAGEVDERGHRVAVEREVGGFLGREPFAVGLAGSKIHLVGKLCALVLGLDILVIFVLDRLFLHLGQALGILVQLADKLHVLFGVHQLVELASDGRHILTGLRDALFGRAALHIETDLADAAGIGFHLVEQREELLELFLIVLCVVHVYISFSIG